MLSLRFCSHLTSHTAVGRVCCQLCQRCSRLHKLHCSCPQDGIAPLSFQSQLSTTLTIFCRSPRKSFRVSCVCNICFRCLTRTGHAEFCCESGCVCRICGESGRRVRGRLCGHICPTHASLWWAPAVCGGAGGGGIGEVGSTIRMRFLAVLFGLRDSSVSAFIFVALFAFLWQLQ